MDERKKKINYLLEVCKKYQGEYLDSHHGEYSWATSYHNYFIDAATDLYIILRDKPFVPPLEELGHLLRKSGVRSCRGTSLTGTRLQYLYDKIEEEINHRKNSNIIYKPRY